VRPGVRQYRRRARLAGRELRQSRGVHDLSRALAGYSKVHGLPHPRIPKTVRRRRLSAQHAADDRPFGAGAVSDRGERGCGVVAEQDLRLARRKAANHILGMKRQNGLPVSSSKNSVKDQAIKPREVFDYSRS